MHRQYYWLVTGLMQMIYFREKAIGPRILKERAVYVMTIAPGPGITYFMWCSFRKCCRHSIKVNLDATRDLSTMLASASFFFIGRPFFFEAITTSPWSFGSKGKPDF